MNNANVITNSTCRPRQTLEGYKYIYELDYWTFNTSTFKCIIDFNDLYQFIDLAILEELKKIYSYYLNNYKIATLYTAHIGFRRFLKFTISEYGKIDNININHVLAYFEFLGRNNAAKSNFRNFILKWISLGYKFVDNEIESVIGNIKFKQKTKGESVLTADPVKGPYTSCELSSILQNIDIKFSQNQISYEKYVLAYIYHSLGLRPIQVSLLKIEDYTIKNEHNTLKYYLDVPRVKQGDVFYRDEFHPFELTSELANMIEFWISKIRSDYDFREINFPFSNIPLFPDWNRDDLGEDSYHKTSQSISLEYRKISAIIAITTSRTGENINLTPYRSRKTLGTRAAIEGKNANTIAVLLDHSSTSSVKHYVSFAREIATEVEHSIAKDIEPLIMAFRGEIISDTPIAGTKQRIRNNNPFHADAGICVNKSGCGVYSKDGDIKTILPRIPFCCYTCPFFNAWDDIEVHKEHLFFLQNEQTKILKGYQDDGHHQNHLMSDSLSLTIKAISEVILLIESDKVKDTIDPETI